MDGERLRVSLDTMDIIWPWQGDQEKAHVLLVGRSATEPTTERFMAVEGTFNSAVDTELYEHAVADATGLIADGSGGIQGDRVLVSASSRYAQIVLSLRLTG